MVNQIIPKGRLSSYQRWEMGGFEQADAASAPQSDIKGPERHAAVILPTVEQLERIHQAAHQEGHAAGYEAGYAAGQGTGYEAGRERAATETAKLQDLLSSFQQALAGAHQTIGNDLLTLSLDLAKQMLREALRVKPELVFAVVRESIQQESVFSQPLQLYLHPDDAALVREHLNHELNDCTVRVDAKLERGDCRIRTGNSQVDATLATRWQRIAQALGQNSAWLES